MPCAAGTLWISHLHRAHSREMGEAQAKQHPQGRTHALAGNKDRAQLKHQCIKINKGCQTAQGCAAAGPIIPREPDGRRVEVRLCENWGKLFVLGLPPMDGLSYSFAPQGRVAM